MASVVLDLPLPHLDRRFDYRVPPELDDGARPGVRVRVMFAGREVGGFVAERPAVASYEGRLAPLRRVVSPEPVLTPEVLRLCRSVADRYAGSLSDVLRLAVPPRHAKVESETPPEPVPATAHGDPAAAPLGDPAAAPLGDRGEARTGDTSVWAPYPAGSALLARLRSGGSPRAVWTAPPGHEAWARGIAEAVAATLGSGRGSVVVAPDTRDLDELGAALDAVLGPGGHVRLEADLGPAKRYRAFLAVLRGDVRVVIGTRAAAFAPVRDLGLAVIWQDGDDVHAEPHAPYPHAREVLALRAETEQAALLAAGWARSAESAQWLATGWAREVAAPREIARSAWPRVVAADQSRQDDPAARGRLPGPAWEAIRDGLPDGPVLVQTPRTGYVPGLACQSCRSSARCGHCQGPLASPAASPAATASPAEGSARAARPALAGASTGPGVVRPGPGAPVCRWCGRSPESWSCPRCGGRRLRAQVVGVRRTAEELGRGFPGAAVVVPRPGEPAPRVPDRSIVVATPGLEPPVAEGYATAVLLDGDLLLAQPRLRAGEEALLRWRSAAAFVRPVSAGGRVVICADEASVAVQALLRGDPGWHAERELEERRELRLTPAACVAVLTGTRAAVEAQLALAELPDAVLVFGPVGEADAATATLKAPRAWAAELARRLHAASAVRSARREPDVVRVRIDPVDL